MYAAQTKVRRRTSADVRRLGFRAMWKTAMYWLIGLPNMNAATIRAAGSLVSSLTREKLWTVRSGGVSMITAGTRRREAIGFQAGSARREKDASYTFGRRWYKGVCRSSQMTTDTI